MSEFKGTPGPWKVEAATVEEDGSVYPAHIVGGARDLVICYLTDLASDAMSEGPGDVRSKAANTRLIAAAPALLEALQRIATATPASTNSQTVEQFRSWTQAVAAEVLSLACGEQADAG